MDIDKKYTISTAYYIPFRIDSSAKPYIRAQYTRPHGYICIQNDTK